MVDKLPMVSELPLIPNIPENVSVAINKPLKKGRGRPAKSEIRQNIAELLFFFKSAHGYELYKHYCEVFPDVTMRSIYYHLKKGVQLNEFVVDRVVKEKGEFSWGPEAEKIYYANGPNAKLRSDERVKQYVERINKK